MALKEKPSYAIVVAALVASIFVSLIAVLVAISIMWQRKDRTRPMYVSAPVLSSVSGLLAGLALLVLLPSAVDGLAIRGESSRVMLCFAMGPICMYFFHHVLLDHNCAAHQQEPPDQLAAPPSKKSFWKPQSCDNLACEECTAPCGGLTNFSPAPAPLLDAPRSATSPLARACALLLRVSAWAAHATLDGFMLGSGQSVGMVGATTLPVALCAVQDASSLVLGHLGRGDSQREALTSVLLLATCFPLGAGCALFLASSPSVALASDGLFYMRAFTAGIFLYMAVFEFSPPHPHGRLESLKRLLAFCAGLAMAWGAEAFEDAIVSSTAAERTAAADAAVAALGPAPHLDVNGHWARAAPPLQHAAMEAVAGALLPPAH